MGFECACRRWCSLPRAVRPLHTLAPCSVVLQHLLPWPPAAAHCMCAFILCQESERERKKHSRMYHIVCQRIMENGVRTHAQDARMRVCAHHFPLFSGTLGDTYVSVFFSLSRSPFLSLPLPPCLPPSLPPSLPSSFTLVLSLSHVRSSVSCALSSSLSCLLSRACAPFSLFLSLSFLSLSEFRARAPALSLCLFRTQCLTRTRTRFHSSHPHLNVQCVTLSSIHPHTNSFTHTHTNSWQSRHNTNNY